MPWYDDPRVYYRDITEDEPLNQGDIVIAPTSVLRPGTAATEIAGPAELDQVRESTLWLGSDRLPGAPDFSAITRWGLAMVVPHACAMEKEWNEHVSDLEAGGMGHDEALAEATADASLDPYVTLAPILPYDVLPESRRAGTRTGQRLGRFPVCAKDEVPEAFVDLAQLSTVHYQAVPRVRRIAALGDLALANLHHNLVMNFAGRALSQFADLERAVGQRIENIAVSNRSKGRLVINMVLGNGGELVLESQAVQAAPVAAAAVRPART